MPKVAQSGTEWTPTPAQAAFLRAAAEGGFDRNISALAKAAGVPRRTVYNWLERDPGFKRAWGGLWKTVFSEHALGAVHALVEKALTGDVPAIRLALELAGEYPPPAQRHSHEGKVSLEDAIVRLGEV